MTAKKVLGYTFHEMDELDWSGFAGAEEGSLICYENDMCLILSPSGVIHEMTDGENDEDTGGQIDWTPSGNGWVSEKME